MKPSNFPGRKNARRERAIARMASYPRKTGPGAERHLAELEVVMLRTRAAIERTAARVA